jgi:hypothetical protein
VRTSDSHARTSGRFSIVITANPNAMLVIPASEPVASDTTPLAADSPSTTMTG